jgi:hypothetical protein
MTVERTPFKPELSDELKEIKRRHDISGEIIINKEKKTYCINLKDDKINCIVATAKIKWEDVPFGHLHVQKLGLTNQEKYSGKSYGSILLQELNKFILQNSQVGILENNASSSKNIYDIITYKKIAMKDLYSRYGWGYIDGQSNYMILNGDQNLKAQYAEYLKSKYN